MIIDLLSTKETTTFPAADGVCFLKVTVLCAHNLRYILIILKMVLGIMLLHLIRYSKSRNFVCVYDMGKKDLL